MMLLLDENIRKTDLLVFISIDRKDLTCFVLVVFGASLNLEIAAKTTKLYPPVTTCFITLWLQTKPQTIAENQL
jgi:hypothetical protein